jgi:hypothetical protein
LNGRNSQASVASPPRKAANLASKSALDEAIAGSSGEKVDQAERRQKALDIPASAFGVIGLPKALVIAASPKPTAHCSWRPIPVAPSQASTGALPRFVMAHPTTFRLPVTFSAERSLTRRLTARLPSQGG